MKAHYRDRHLSNTIPEISLAQLLGCVRVVWKDAWAYSTQQYRLGKNNPNSGELKKTFITQAKKIHQRQ
jgi:hypothetical protein